MGLRSTFELLFLDIELCAGCARFGEKRFSSGRRVHCATPVLFREILADTVRNANIDAMLLSSKANAFLKNEVPLSEVATATAINLGEASQIRRGSKVPTPVQLKALSDWSGDSPRAWATVCLELIRGNLDRIIRNRNFDGRTPGRRKGQLSPACTKKSRE